MYKNNLARRLLYSEILSVDVESTFLEKLKKIGAADAFMKATAMLNDYTMRNDLSSDFGAYMKSNGVAASFSIDPLLCSVNWPIVVRPQTFQVSRPMESVFQCFKTFYTRTNKKKTVSLVHQYGRGEIAFYTANGEYFLSGTEYHLVILPMISKEKVTLQHIMDESRLTLEEVKFQLSFLIKHKFVLISNDEEGMPAGDRDKPATWLEKSSVTVNPRFSNPRKKIIISLSRSDKEAARAATAGKVTQEEALDLFEDHVWLAACIMVRVMKTRKTASNRDVFTECASQLAKFFPLNERIFKKAVEKLITEGIVRHPNRTDLEYTA